MPRNPPRSPAAVPTKPTGNGQPRADHVYERLRAGILERVFEPGSRLREEELADWLDVSRTPVREALRRLISQGLLVNAPGRGLIVRKLTLGEIDELYVLREVLEGTAARLAAQHASESEIATLKALIDESVRRAGDYAELARLNRRFHAVMYGACHNLFLLEALDNLSTALALLPTTLSLPGREAEAIREHRSIVRAIEDRDGDRAESLTRKHVAGARKLRAQLDA